MNKDATEFALFRAACHVKERCESVGWVLRLATHFKDFESERWPKRLQLTVRTIAQLCCNGSEFITSILAKLTAFGDDQQVIDYKFSLSIAFF